jgi:phage terminase small subunit
MKLTPKQEAFAQHYALHGDGLAAYKAAGYSWTRMKPDTLRVKAHEVFANGNVSVRIAELQERIKERAEHVFDITADRILQELASIGFVNFLDFVHVNEATGEARVDLRKIKRHHGAAISSYKVKTYPERGADGEFETVKEIEFKLMDKKGALVELGKYAGVLSDKVVHEHTVKFEAIKDASAQLDAGIDQHLARFGETPGAHPAQVGSRSTH